MDIVLPLPSCNSKLDEKIKKLHINVVYNEYSFFYTAIDFFS